MRTDTYWDLPELNNIPMPFTADDIFNEYDFDLIGSDIVYILSLIHI